MSRIAALSTHAPLMSMPAAPCPINGQGEWCRGVGGLRLRTAHWMPESSLRRGTIFLSTGRAEAIEKYYELIRDLIRSGFSVVAHDWRGQGLSARLVSDRLKGHARSQDEFLDDYTRILDHYEGTMPRPWIALGHSMGGCLNLLTAIRGEPRLDGFMCPMLRIKTGNHAHWMVKMRAGMKVKNGLATEYVPEAFDDPFEHTFENDALTSDEVRYEHWREQLFACPHLALGSITWGWLDFALKAGEMALKAKALKKVKQPVLILQAAQDTIVSKAHAKEAAKRLLKGIYVEIQAAQHEIYIESDEKRVQVLEAISGFLNDHAPLGETTMTSLTAPLSPDEA